MRTSVFGLLFGSILLGVSICAVVLFLTLSFAIFEDQWHDFARDVQELQFAFEEECDFNELDLCLEEISEHQSFIFEKSFEQPNNEDYIGEYHDLKIFDTDYGGFSAVVPLDYDALETPVLLLIRDHPDDFLDESDGPDIVLWGVIIGISVLTLVLGLFLYFPARRINRWLLDVQQANEQISQQNYEARLQKSRVQPFEQLSESFNSMAARIQQQMRDQHILANAIAHELRTPLMRYRLALGLLKRTVSSKNNVALLQDLENYTDELEQITTNTLQLATLRDADMKLDQVELYGFITGCIKKYQVTHEDIDIQLNAADITVNSDMRYLQLAFDNLMSNACCYANSIIKIECKKIDSNVCISVIDDGQGIPEESLQYILKPFARLDQSRSRETGGAGLGLAIVNVAVQRLKGTLNIQSSNQGTIMSLVLPIEASS